jgi:ubiquinone/menaquinone biosynthesis C-methylase UbiE
LYSAGALLCSLEQPAPGSKNPTANAASIENERNRIRKSGRCVLKMTKPASHRNRLYNMRSASVYARAFLFAALAVASAWGQSVHPLTGRRIAPTMGIGGADWLERSNREMEEHPDEALDALGIRAGMIVADVGAGTGYITQRLAKRVGPAGKVYANDVQPEMLSRLQEHLEQNHITNVETVLGTQTNPNLPANTFDLILMVDVYHEFSQPQRMLQELKKSLKPDGRLVLIEYRKEDPTIPIRPEHKMSLAEVKTEVEAEGYRLVEVNKTLPRQNIFAFKKTPVM